MNSLKKINTIKISEIRTIEDIIKIYKEYKLLDKTKKVIFDFSNVAFMDSAGIGMLLGRYKVIKMLGGQLELMNVNKQVEKVFEISGILKIIPLIKNNEEEVLLQIQRLI